MTPVGVVCGAVSHARHATRSASSNCWLILSSSRVLAPIDAFHACSTKRTSGAVRWVPNTGSAAISTNLEFPVLGSGRRLACVELSAARLVRRRTTATGPLILNEPYYPIISDAYINSCDSTYVSTVDRSLSSPRLLAQRRPSRCHRKASCPAPLRGPPAPMDSSHNPTDPSDWTWRSRSPSPPHPIPRPRSPCTSRPEKRSNGLPRA
jgi:hypothetical protein